MGEEDGTGGRRRRPSPGVRGLERTRAQRSFLRERVRVRG
ncbi:hypothetical protein HMPREF0185_03147 [Brevundimonas diminuta 470-4]|nr:hypothetical protein HMPREF0185_03147 [Brevundimonas diminuta 470-4]